MTRHLSAMKKKRQRICVKHFDLVVIEVNNKNDQKNPIIGAIPTLNLSNTAKEDINSDQCLLDAVQVFELKEKNPIQCSKSRLKVDVRESRIIYRQTTVF